MNWVYHTIIPFWKATLPNPTCDIRVIPNEISWYQINFLYGLDISAYRKVLNWVPSRIVSRLEYSPHRKLEILIESLLE